MRVKTGSLWSRLNCAFMGHNWVSGGAVTVCSFCDARICHMPLKEEKSRLPMPTGLNFKQAKVFSRFMGTVTLRDCVTFGRWSDGGPYEGSDDFVITDVRVVGWVNERGPNPVRDGTLFIGKSFSVKLDTVKRGLKGDNGWIKLPVAAIFAPTDRDVFKVGGWSSHNGDLILDVIANIQRG